MKCEIRCEKCSGEGKHTKEGTKFHINDYYDVTCKKCGGTGRLILDTKVLLVYFNAVIFFMIIGFGIYLFKPEKNVTYNLHNVTYNNHSKELCGIFETRKLKGNHCITNFKNPEYYNCSGILKTKDRLTDDCKIVDYISSADTLFTIDLSWWLYLLKKDTWEFLDSEK